MRHVFQATVCGSLLMMVSNLLLLHQHEAPSQQAQTDNSNFHSLQQRIPLSGGSNSIAQNSHNNAVLRGTKLEDTSVSTTQNHLGGDYRVDRNSDAWKYGPTQDYYKNRRKEAYQYDPPSSEKRSRTLIGIISADVPNDRTYRKRHRDLWNHLWKEDSRCCKLHEYLYDPHQYDGCQLMYTFILGGNASATPMLLDDSRPITVPLPTTSSDTYDLTEPDMTFLNIRENMNDGKSPTFFYYASLLMQQHDIHYAMKLDADSILHLHDYFKFAHSSLPPPPYNHNIFVGALRDKAYWPKHPPSELGRFESFWGNEFEGVHLYLAGQLYLASADLCATIAEEAKTAEAYWEGHEDADVSAMAFHARQPVHMITIAKSQRFWEHPVKGEPRWNRIWARESARMKGDAWEGKTLSLYTAA